MDKFKVTLTTEERTALEHLVSVGKAAARKLAHARVLLLADEGPSGPRRTDEDMVGPSTPAVKAWARAPRDPRSPGTDGGQMNCTLPLASVACSKKHNETTRG